MANSVSPSWLPASLVLLLVFAAAPVNAECDGDDCSGGVEWWLTTIIIVGVLLLIGALAWLMYKHHTHHKKIHGTKHHVTRRASVERAERRASQEASKRYKAHEDAVNQDGVVKVQPSDAEESPA